MKKVTIIVLAILLQVVMYVGVANSDETTKRKTRKQPVAPTKASTTSRYLNVSFDPAIEKIPVPYLGHDIEQVYKAFDERKRAEQKDEFESTEQYQRRLATQDEKPLFGSVGQNSILAFVSSPSSAYDADSQTLKISLHTSPVWQSVQIDRSRLALEIKSEITKKKSMGQNAYGAKVEIEELYVKEFELAIHNQVDFETEKDLGKSWKDIQSMMSEYNLPSESFKGEMEATFVKRLKMQPADARTVKDKIAALILVKPTAPFISSGATLHEATFKDPNQFLGQMYYVDVDLLEIWIYNKQSGELLTKIKGK
ncbi:MAG: hypothetical protein ABIB41_02890 [Nitrospirota bacterium]